jgi:DNA repair protein RadC
MAEEGKADREAMWVLHLNTKNKIIEKELVSLGSLDSSIAHPREVFRKAVINSSSCIITVHNHPSGEPIPSAEDYQTWNNLVKAGEILSIHVIDNMIITPNGRYYSSKEHRQGVN